MRMVRPVLIAFLCCATAGCVDWQASPRGIVLPPPSYQPIIEQQGIDPERYRSDLADCRARADETAAPVARAAETGGLFALIGAALGAGLFAIAGPHVGGGAAVGAFGGAGFGAAKGNAAGLAERDRAIDACLAERGYRIMNLTEPTDLVPPGEERAGAR
jgi:hypothetical protein